MTVRSAIATIVGCTLLVGAIGASVGYGLGTFAPGYYRSVCRSSREPWFDPVSVGVGYGLTQGTAGGVVVGLALVALLSWRETRLQRVAGSPPPGDGRTAGSGSLARRLLMITGLLLALGFCLSFGVILGLLAGETGAYHRRYLEEKEVIAPILAADPALAAVELDEYPGGGVCLVGDVPTPEDLERLQSGVVRAVGQRRAEEVMGAVGVRR